MLLVLVAAFVLVSTYVFPLSFFWLGLVCMYFNYQKVSQLLVFKEKYSMLRGSTVVKGDPENLIKGYLKPEV